VEEVEQRIETLEREIARTSAALEDPALYTKPNGVAEAKTLGVSLERAKRELDAALERWNVATEAVEALNRELASTET